MKIRRCWSYASNISVMYLRILAGGKTVGRYCKTVGRYCNRCTYCLPREEWDLCNWKEPVDTEVNVAACTNCSERNQSSQRPIRKCKERYSEVLGIRSADPRFVGGNIGDHGPLYLDGDLQQKNLRHTHNRTEQEVYVWMTTGEMVFPLTQERVEVQGTGTLWKTDR
jgi:hypothetical protein